MEVIRMQRIKVTDDYGGLAGTFDLEAAERWTDRLPGEDRGSRGSGRGEAVIRTAQGRWVQEQWTLWQGETAGYRYITATEAREWLLLSGEDEAVEQHWGPQPDEEGPRLPGRPEIGPQIQVRLPADMLTALDARAAETGVSRAEAIRRALGAGL